VEEERDGDEDEGEAGVGRRAMRRDLRDFNSDWRSVREEACVEECFSRSCE